ncbi:hypothetical protein EUBC25_14770 [Claveliimonas bilis]|uniref:sigma-70 family RNA polymerase sigma factor n=1 Tax=Claveliimonas bilis TaxID=3028070 RepID=UPI001E5DFA2B|nr:sigma-70 family RNA polymerase sigma factor [Claveliimonas bilis]BCZ27390.1 hypothetical protein EUBC25_14770 [Claveliimonas bilis]
MSMNLENRISNEQLVSRIQSGENEAENMLKLWQQNRGFIARMARKYAGLAEMEDLEQEGYIGLCEAVRHYEPDKGMKFINYAAFWIKQAMKRYIENAGAVVRIPSNMQDWIREYNRALREYRQAYHEWPSDGALCWLLGIKKEKLRDIQQAVRMGNMGSLDAPLEMEDGGLTMMDMVSSGEDLEEDACTRMDKEQMGRKLWLAVDQLPGDLPAAVRLRYKDGLTLEKTGQALGVNRERARQLESKAMRILRQPHRCRTFRAHYEEYLAAAPIRHIGVRRFQETWTSEVEREAIEWAERELHYR